MADQSVGARDKLHESEASEASVFCFDKASPEKSCFMDGLVFFIYLFFYFFLTALLTITRIMNKINNREEMKYMCKVVRSDEVKRAGANGTRGPMRGTAHYIKKKRRYK